MTLKISGVYKNGPDGLKLDFLKSMDAKRKWAKDPSDIASHPRLSVLVRDTTEVKTSAVNPLIRMSDVESPSNGNDVQTPLMSNPYQSDPALGEEYENGYQFAQGLGHAGLNAANDAQLQSWSQRNQAWRDGFSAAAGTMGVAGIQDRLDATPKVAIVTPRTMNYLAGGSGFGVGADLGAANSRTGLKLEDIPEEDLMQARGNGRAVASIGALTTGLIGGLGLAAYEHSPSTWGDNLGDTAKNFLSGSTASVAGGLITSMFYGSSAARRLLKEEAARRAATQPPQP